MKIINTIITALFITILVNLFIYYKIYKPEKEKRETRDKSEIVQYFQIYRCEKMPEDSQYTYFIKYIGTDIEFQYGLYIHSNTALKSDQKLKLITCE